MGMDVYRPLSFEDVKEFNPFRGNEFQKLYRTRSKKEMLLKKIVLVRYVKSDHITEDEATKNGAINYKNQIILTTKMVTSVIQY